MKTRIKKRPLWKAVQEIFGEAYENVSIEASDYFEAETRLFKLKTKSFEAVTATEFETASLAFDKAWDSAFDYGKVQAVIRERFNVAFEAAIKAARES